MNRPMPPRVRLEQQLLTLCETFWRGHGIDAHTPAGMQRRASIWALTGRKPRLQDFEEALNAIDERDRIESGSLTLWDGEREIPPGDPDYAACKTLDLETQADLIRVAIRNLIPN